MIVGVFITAAVLLVGLGGLLAAAGSALSALSRQDLAELADDARFSRSLRAIAADPGAHANALSFVRIIAETAAAVLVTLAFAQVFAQWWWTLLAAAIIMTAVSFVLVGSSPRAVGRAHARTLLRGTAPLVRAVRVIIGPLADLLVRLGDRVTPGRPRAASFASEEQLLSMVDEATEAAVLEEADRELIHSIFEFGQTLVREVMVPRTDMVTVDGDEPIARAVELFHSRGVSRIPVVGEDVDEILGVVYLRDAVRAAAKDGSLATVDVARPALFVPESQKADALLRQLQRESNHLAMVVDEYGGIAGLVTMEDLIEELVGDIADEYDREAPEIEELGQGRLRVAARLPTDELGERLEVDLEDDEVDSVGGLLTKTLGRLPEGGDSVHIAGLKLTAERVQRRRRRLATVLVERITEPEPETAGGEETS